MTWIMSDEPWLCNPEELITYYQLLTNIIEEYVAALHYLIQFSPLIICHWTYLK